MSGCRGPLGGCLAPLRPDGRRGYGAARAPSGRPRPAPLGPQTDTASDKKDCQAVATPVTREWHVMGNPWMLLVLTGQDVGRHFIALFLIAINAFVTHDNLMNCHIDVVGPVLAVLCEYTKAYVRCFPLLGVVVALMVASRQIMQQRIYYEMLKHGALLDIDNFTALQDPLFYLMLWCSANALLHFVLNIWVSHDVRHASEEELASLQAHVKQAALFFVVPVGLFFSFLWQSYDVEASLVPLSKYFEEDPEAARQTLEHIAYLPEAAVATAVRRDICVKDSPALQHAMPPAQAYRRLIDCAAARQRAAKDGKGSPSRGMERLSNWRLTSTLWPSFFLLHPCFQDQDSKSFRRAWYCFTAVSLLIMAVVLIFFAWAVHNKFLDIQSGQHTDVAGALVSFLHMVVTAWLALGLMRNVAVPLIEPVEQ